MKPSTLKFLSFLGQEIIGMALLMFAIQDFKENDYLWGVVSGLLAISALLSATKRHDEAIKYAKRETRID